MGGKKTTWLYIDTWCVGNDMKGLLICCWCYITIVLFWIVNWYENSHLLIFYEHFIFIVFEKCLWQVLCELRKYKKLNRMYHFEGCVACCDKSYILRDALHAVAYSIFKGCVTCHNVFIIKDRVTLCDKCMNIHFPHGSRTERQRLCIAMSDMYHCTFA